MSDVETTTTAVEAQPEAAQPAPTPTPEPAAAASAPQDPAAAQYTPDYKFRYTDEHENKVDGEIEEWARQFVNKDTEEKFKTLWAKAHGLDFVKSRFSKTRDEYKTFRGQVEPLLQAWNDVSQLYSKGDMEGFFKGLQVPDEKIFKYVLDKLNYNELPPEQKALRDQQQQVLRQNMELEKQNQFFQQQYETQMVQQREHALGQTLAKPEVSAVAQAFDARVGRPGAFRDEVVKRGILHWQMNQQDLSPEQAVQEVMSLIGAGMGAQPQAPQAVPTLQQQKAPSVIPNVGSKNTSPAKRAPRSLEEMRKLADQL